MKYLRALLGSLLLLSFMPFSQAQLVFSGSNWTIGTLNLENSTYQILGSPPASTPKRLYTDIAMTPDGRILASGGILSQADGINESYLIAINTHNVLESDTLFVLYGSQTGSLACDSAYNVYMGSGSLYSYNLLTEELTFLGTNPNGWNTGDIAWFDGQLYGSQISLFQTNGNPPPHFFRYDFDAVNIDQSASTTDEFPFFIGLSKVYDYQNERFRFIGNEAIRGCCEGVRDTSVLYEIFLEDTTYTELFRLALEPFDRYMTGLASSDEFRRNFSLQLDLDADDSSGRFIDHHQVDGLCTRTFRLADTDTRIRATAAGVDSLVVELALGVHPLGEELLSVTALPGFVVEGNGTTRIKVIPNDIADIENLELLISSFQLNIAGDTLRTGERRVDFFLYSQDQVSDGSMAFVYPQPDVVPYPGEDYALELCPQTTENLFVGLGEGVYTDGHWSPALGGSFDNYFNPAAGAGVYYYIVQEGSCGPDSVAVTISITDQLLFNYGGTSRNVQDVYLCPGDTVVWAANTSVLQSWEWSVGNPTATQIMISTPGVYNLLAYDINGCEYYYRTRFKYPDWEDWSGQGPYLMTDTVTRCAGTTLGFFGNSVSTDTIICATVPSTSDCDFTHCRTFRFLPDIEVRDTVSICAGTNYTWYNQPYTQAGTYSYLIPSEVNTCDTLALLALNVYPTYERNFVVNLPPGSSFTVGDSVLTQAGLYSILLATTQGCDSLINVEVEVATELDELQSAQCLIPNLLQKGQAPWQIICPYGVRLVEWELYDVHGRKIVAEVQPAATLVLLNEQAQARLSAGVYFYHLVLEEGGISRHKTGKVVFLE